MTMMKTRLNPITQFLKNLMSQQTSLNLNQNSSQNTTLSAPNSHVSHLVSREDSSDSLTPEELSFLKSCELLLPKKLHIYSLRTLKTYFRTTKERHLEPSLEPLMNVGMMYNGRLSTVDISEFLNIEKDFSLLQILEENPDQKYFLSNKVLQQMKSLSRC